MAGWQAGVDGSVLRRLVGYWIDGYDWRAQEDVINRLPHRFAEIEGGRVHYLYFESEGASTSRPLLLGNGWPSTFLEMVDLAQRLAARGLTVVVPSLPGFAFSDVRVSLENSPPTHELWHRLMHDVLGVERYGVHGGDLSSRHVSWLAQAHPEHVIGLHLCDVENALQDGDVDVTDEERDFLAAEADWQSREGGYAHQQRTRPLTLAQGLGDSPSGLLAWILEKYQAWSDCDGDVSARFSDDFLITQASLYWFTNTISTSFRDYYERENLLLTSPCVGGGAYSVHVVPCRHRRVAAPQMDRATFQPDPLHRHAARRTLRCDGGAGAPC
ncbi:epoxide hydrolase family protein [Nocardioides eburneiflavus]|uniref:epoxide hydrolase family protein n=1 Tax=Nocardioides eburneiflavus TaxID=2518372 RepID=UPI001FE7A016|nr:epoxide hydrolase [Nocardioides eburneiflavus]